MEGICWKLRRHVLSQSWQLYALPRQRALTRPLMQLLKQTWLVESCLLSFDFILLEFIEGCCVYGFFFVFSPNPYEVHTWFSWQCPCLSRAVRTRKKTNLTLNLDILAHFQSHNLGSYFFLCYFDIFVTMGLNAYS